MEDTGEDLLDNIMAEEFEGLHTFKKLASQRNKGVLTGQHF